ncbi:MAG: Uma2 family endonuclease [Coleofasciculaceae cyanobacterium RL_1_1]|nr:Uma2 family endonuclease [Coleofasciculaceae cyanobacterium RL_1_1]
MIANRHHAHYSPAAYLELERLSPIKHEYLQGQVIAMAGASKAHAIITGNLTALLTRHLRGTRCLAFASDIKVRLNDRNAFYYPDLVVTCDDRDRDADDDALRHPTLIVEVLSKTTAAFDRGDKFADYQTLDHLQEYVLIHQDQILVEIFRRQTVNLWSPTVYRSGDRLEFPSLNFSCAIEDLYENLDQLR